MTDLERIKIAYKKFKANLYFDKPSYHYVIVLYYLNKKGFKIS